MTCSARMFFSVTYDLFKLSVVVICLYLAWNRNLHDDPYLLRYRHIEKIDETGGLYLACLGANQEMVWKG